MGNQELTLLGYEDIEEFRNYHNDFADLFINKPGFIFKFKNFSWIDYTLHSGTPNRRVLIKTKNGRELDTSLNINEIFLPKEINGCSVFYSVELTNAPLKHDLPSSLQTPTPISETVQIDSLSTPSFNTASEADVASNVSFTAPIEPSSFLYDYQTPTPTLHEESAVADEPEFLSNDDSTFQSSFETPKASEPSDTNEFKLKFDHTILDTPQTESQTAVVDEEPVTPKEYDSIDQIQPNDLHFNASLEKYPDDRHEDLLNDKTLFVEELRTESLPDTSFDLAECAEELGLDISTLAQIIEEYVDNLTTSMPMLTQAIQDNNRLQAKEEISKLKSIALHLHIISLFHHFEHLETSLDFDTKEEILQTLKALQSSVNSFKESVL
jgi:hypothetical protein